jgi:hypothetical protein
MNQRKAALIRRLTRMASPLSATPKEIRQVYRGIKAQYLSKPRPARAAYIAKLHHDAVEAAAVILADKTMREAAENA